MRRLQWTVLASASTLLAVTLVAPPPLGIAGDAGPRVAMVPRAATAPQVVPALREWAAGTGSYTFAGTARVVADSGYASQLATTAAVFATDLRSLTGLAVPSVTGGQAEVRVGDVFLTLGSTDAALGAEGYGLSVGPSLTIQARTDAGAFNGSRTVLQLLSHTRVIAAGTARDWPVTAQRSLMVDNGRKYYSMIWLRNQVRQLAYLKYNVLHLHISDDQGFRVESTGHPEIVSARHYTKAQVAELVAFAARYHVTVIPEIDMPSHMDAILASHTDLRLVSARGTVSPGKLDISKAAARQLATDLVSEYLPLFPATIWHIGADEYLDSTQYASYPQLAAYAEATYGPGATGQDAFLGFVNTVDGLVRAAGKTLRMWNDGIVGGRNVALRTDIQVDYWANNGATAEQLRSAGHQLVNSNDGYLYYVLGKDWKPNPATIYTGFATNLFQDGSTIPLTDPGFLGTSLSIWGDVPRAESEVQVAADALPAQQALAQVIWGSPKLVADYAGFQAVASAVGQPPGQEANSGRSPITNLPTYQAYWPSFTVDGNAGTWFWSSRAATAGDYVGVDLGAVRPVTSVQVAMGSGDRPDDYLHAAALEYSLDGASWTAVGTFSGQPEVRSSPAGGVDARYLRLRATAGQTNWVVVREFAVSVRPAATPTTSLPAYQSYLPANLVDGDVTSWFWSDGAPAVGGYVGVDLGAVRPIGAIDLLMANDASENDYLHRGVLEYSTTGSSWTALVTFSGQHEITASPPAGATARYVRARSTGSQTYWLVADEFLVS
jgi:hexosaminidase